MCAAADDAPPDTTGAPVTLVVDLTGTVVSHCGYAAMPPSSANLGDLSVAGSMALPFTLDCNIPFAVKVRSSNGALTRTVAAVATDGFTTSVDYAVAVSVETDLDPVSAQCPVHGLTTCVLGTGLSSGDGVGIGTSGTLTVSWAKPAARPVAGSYVDQITLTVEVRA